ncbi:hypothetical protein [Peptostreptococcus faecalis]|uniref:hypothetical protein n=1 Tax=Peptostreptococcus faecalis TaxID=2045015 RepID=UPI000C7C62FC|nr:hypothetical protein [Peptostreptococcus faecalis]
MGLTRDVQEDIENEEFEISGDDKFRRLEIQLLLEKIASLGEKCYHANNRVDEIEVRENTLAFKLAEGMMEFDKKHNLTTTINLKEFPLDLRCKIMNHMIENQNK